MMSECIDQGLKGTCVSVVSHQFYELKFNAVKTQDLTLKKTLNFL